jgi:murein L,D-transpeptidase YcbB/YkuD
VVGEAGEAETPVFEAQLATALTQSIVLTAPLPIVVTYLTARVDDAGTVFFYRDIYGRD